MKQALLEKLELFNVNSWRPFVFKQLNSEDWLFRVQDERKQCMKLKSTPSYIICDWRIVKRNKNGMRWLHLKLHCVGNDGPARRFAIIDAWCSLELILRHLNNKTVIICSAFSAALAINIHHLKKTFFLHWKRRATVLSWLLGSYRERNKVNIDRDNLIVFANRGRERKERSNR